MQRDIHLATNAHPGEYGWVFSPTFTALNARYSLKWAELENLSSDIALREMCSYDRTKVSLTKGQVEDWVKYQEPHQTHQASGKTMTWGEHQTGHWTGELMRTKERKPKLKPLSHAQSQSRAEREGEGRQALRGSSEATAWHLIHHNLVLLGDVCGSGKV